MTTSGRTGRWSSRAVCSKASSLRPTRSSSSLTCRPVRSCSAVCSARCKRRWAIWPTSCRRLCRNLPARSMLSATRRNHNHRLLPRPEVRRKSMAKVTVDDFVSTLKEWTVVDVMNAIKAIENEFGVTAAAPVAVGAAPTAGGGAAAAAPEAEQTEFQVVLTSPGDAKIGVMKVVREITGLGLKESKDLVDQAPKPVKQGVNREEAESVLKKLKDAGASAEIK